LFAVCLQARERSEDFIFADDDVAEPVWEHEARFKGQPMTREHSWQAMLWHLHAVLEVSQYQDQPRLLVVLRKELEQRHAATWLVRVQLLLPRHCPTCLALHFQHHLYMFCYIPSAASPTAVEELQEPVPQLVHGCIGCYADDQCSAS
jgi:hypothetical protein